MASPDSLFLGHGVNYQARGIFYLPETARRSPGDFSGF